MDFNQLLGLRLIRKFEDGILISLPLRREFMNLSGVLHGGVTATLADAAMGMAIVKVLGRRCTTVEMKINYFLPVTGKRVTARSRFLRQGKTLVVGSVEIYDDRRRLAGAALITYMLL
jgi:acyl-CoA thioesterase